jgi:hypothetical protein
MPNKRDPLYGHAAGAAAEPQLARAARRVLRSGKFAVTSCQSAGFADPREVYERALARLTHRCIGAYPIGVGIARC